jgi:hypothetical protein
MRQENHDKKLEVNAESQDTAEVKAAKQELMAAADDLRRYLAQKKIAEDMELVRRKAKGKKAVVGKEIPSRIIDGQFCRVIRYAPSATAHIDKKGKHLFGRKKLYAILHIESTTLPQDIDCIYKVTNREEFMMLDRAFKEIDSSTQEIIFGYSTKRNLYPKSVKGYPKELAKIAEELDKAAGYPELRVYIYKKGALEQLYDENKKLFDTIDEMKIKEFEPSNVVAWRYL